MLVTESLVLVPYANSIMRTQVREKGKTNFIALLSRGETGNSCPRGPDFAYQEKQGVFKKVNEGLYHNPEEGCKSFVNLGDSNFLNIITPNQSLNYFIPVLGMCS